MKKMFILCLALVGSVSLFASQSQQEKQALQRMVAGIQSQQFSSLDHPWKKCYLIAAATGDLQTVKKCAGAGVTLFEKDGSYNMSALDLAARFGREHVVSYLISVGENIREKQVNYLGHSKVIPAIDYAAAISWAASCREENSAVLLCLANSYASKSDK